MVYNLGVLYVCVNSALRYSRGVGSFWTGSSEGDWEVWEHWEGTEDIKIVGICLLEFHLSYFMCTPDPLELHPRLAVSSIIELNR